MERGGGERDTHTKEGMELINNREYVTAAARGMRRAWCVLDSSVSCKASRASKASNPVTGTGHLLEQEEKLSCMHEWQRERERSRERERAE